MFRSLPNSTIVIIGCLWIAGALAAPPDAGDADWLDLFNGANLDGWTVKVRGYEAGEDPYDTFRVKDGLLTVSYADYPAEGFGGRFGHLFFDTPYSHYVLHLEYRFVGEQVDGGPAWAERNSGAMLHAQDPQTMHRDQDFPVSIEAQFLGGLGTGRARPTANVCTPGTDITVNNAIYPHHCLASGAPTHYGNQWVNVTVVVLGGGSVTHYVEREEVLSYHYPRLDSASTHQRSGSPEALQSGYIALQSESAPIQFRQVRLLNLTGCRNPQAQNYKPYIVNSDNSLCRFSD